MSVSRELPRVSIIIPVYNGETFLEKCIDSIRKQDYPGSLIDILVINNASTDNTQAIIDKLGLKSIYVEKRGPSAARNAGLKYVKGDILLFLDMDCIADRDLIKEHVAAHRAFEQKDPRVRVIGGGIAGYNRNFWALCDDFCSWYFNHPNLKPRITNTHPTANLSMSCDILDKIKPFDEELGYSEDYVFCTDIIRSGFKIYFHPPAKVKHINRTSFKAILAHSREWAGTQYEIREKGYVRRDFLKNPLVAVLYYLFVYIHMKLWDLIYLAIRSKRLSVLVCLPVILLVRTYFFYFELKAEIRFCRKKNKLLR